MTAVQIEQKIEETKSQLSQDKARLNRLRSERAELVIEGKSTATLDSEIAALRDKIENTPAVVSELETQLVDEQTKQKQQEHQQTLSKQREAAAEIERLSKELVDALGHAMSLNTQLQEAYEEYEGLRRQTGQGTISQKVTQGSHGMLQFVHDICSQEIEGKRPSRPALPPPSPRI